ncbi:MAG: hypothetical protein B7X86_11420 [Sphingobacteriales bacterium 17-39-43]|uniref:hypothetical protein n=1 Tax=Daejeonella sp. TaxID=2805397 RepID=UPI000BDA116E|nr:hypothetical protein [Daejeonella sp.]MCF8451814.1 hypothetical protein [Pedobacter sp.]OYZ30867.1 MAG: hypothetical protein B7Y24_11360 [Sphingobacteriales bacterium 16-39-50]OYZ57175.1 MAG: hypothetical protein B7Y19_02950 [Sphingobacteriales bacterium 24-40-4]OZA23653.1 MAG: hypothetical protein B7X86_11420 [Sphingobacteriales bacterium 17-39-43]HQS05176.1 hypothetical protein [Daejeonella sp.]
MKKYKVYILAVSVLIIISIIWNTLTEPGIKDLKSDFKEVAFIRNEQNTGPVIRIYAVSIKTENWEEMEQYGNYMPHTKYGTTRIYFFLNNGEIPEELNFGEVNIPDRYKKNCIAIYEKDGMSQISIRKYPFNN